MLSLKCFFVFSLLVSVQGWTKTFPYDQNTVQQISELFLVDSLPSSEKISSYETRLQQKLFEMSHLVATNERRLGETDETEISEKVAGSDIVIALKKSLYLLGAMRNETHFNELLRKAHDVLDLEGAIRIEGSSNSFYVIIEQLRNYLGVWTIPYSSFATDEASNLYDPANGQFLSAENMGTKDLSLFDPDPQSSFWINPGDLSKVDMNRASQGELTPFYEGADIHFPEVNSFKFSEVKHSDTKPKMDVYYKNSDGKKIKYKFKLGAEIHADPTLASLMMALGFGADVTKYVKNVRIDLGKKYTLSDLSRDWEVYYHRDSPHSYKIENYVKDSGEDENGHFVIFKEGLLEAKPSKIGRLGGWSFKDLGNSSAREVRGMTLVQMWLDNTDIKEFENNKILVKGDKNFHIIADLGKAMGGSFGEKPDLFYANMISSRGRNGVSFNYHAFHSVAVKNQMTFADARWAGRLIGSLSRAQITTAVQIGQWPECLAKIYVEKLLSRRNDLLTNLNLLGEKDRSGKPLALIPLLLTPEQMNFSSACKQSDVQDSTLDFDFSTGFLLKPYLKAALNKLMDSATNQIGQANHVTFSDADFAFEKSVVSQLIFSLKREVEQNPDPKSEKDLFIARDHFEIGFRLGVAFGVYKDVTYTRAFSLAYPVRSREEARLKNGFIVDVLLPKNVREGELPKQYVLHTDHFFQNGIGVDADDITKPVSVTVRAKISKARILRSILDHRDPDKIVIYRDRSDYAEAYLASFVRVGPVKLPFLTTTDQWGSASGAGAVLTKEHFASEPSLEDHLMTAAVSGDFTALRKHEEDFYLRNRFQEKNFNWNFIFWKGTSTGRLDHITIERGEDNDDVLEYRTSRTRSWNFFGKGEKKSVTAEVMATADKKSFQLKLKVACMDKNTKDSELEKKYLYFINGLSVTGDKIIPFTPSLGYTTNGKWGPLLTRSETTYYPEAIDKIIAMNESEIWRSMGQVYGVKFTQTYANYLLAKEDMRNSTGSNGSDILRDYNIDSDTYQLFTHTEDFLKDLRNLKKELNITKRIKKLGQLFRKLAFHSKPGFFEPRLIGAINRLAGKDNIFSMNIISPPPFAEMNMPADAPLYGEIGKARPDEEGYLNYVPETPMEQYYLFNNWRIL